MSRSMYQFTPEILEFKNMEGKLMVLYDLGAQTAQSSVLPASKQKKCLTTHPDVMTVTRGKAGCSRRKQLVRKGHREFRRSDRRVDGCGSRTARPDRWHVADAFIGAALARGSACVIPSPRDLLNGFFEHGNRLLGGPECQCQHAASRRGEEVDDGGHGERDLCLAVDSAPSSMEQPPALDPYDGRRQLLHALLR